MKIEWLTFTVITTVTQLYAQDVLSVNFLEDIL